MTGIRTEQRKIKSGLDWGVCLCRTKKRSFWVGWTITAPDRRVTTQQEISMGIAIAVVCTQTS